MIPEKSNYSVSEHSFRTKAVSIKEKNLIHLASLFSDDIYSNKPLALIREYSANAYDANIAAGKKDVPIQISLPSKFNPQLKIRDFGYGLTQEEMDDIYASIGESTKRGSNTEVGCFGLGCKAGYSYGSRSFIVNSFNKGVKTTYNCVKSPVNFADIITLNSVESTELSGLEIVINVQIDDIEMFRNEAIKFFKFWDVMPNIEGFTADDYEKIRGNQSIKLTGTNWSICHDSNNYRNYNRCSYSVAIMGNIAYPINWDSVKGFNEFIRTRDVNNEYSLRAFITDNSFVFRFNIGEVKMSPNRETLQYTDLTNNALLQKLDVIMDEVSVMSQSKLDNATNRWDACVIYNTMFTNGGCLNHLKGTISLNYNGWTITNNKIGDFAKKYKSVLKTYYRRGRNMNFYGYACGDYRWHEISCTPKSMILELDQTDKVYIQKAVKYLSEIKAVDTIYVLTFTDNDQRSAVFADIGLDDSFITKYSTIADAVKKVVTTRNTSGCVSITPKSDGTKRYLRYTDGSDSRYYNHYNNGVTNLRQEDVDLSDGGIYVETTDNEITNSVHRLGNIKDMVTALNKINNTATKVYFIGQNYMGGKLMNSTKWVKFDNHITKIANELIEKNDTLRLISTLAKMENTDTIVNLNESFVKFLSVNKSGISKEINALVSLFSHMVDTNIRNNVTIVNPNFTPSDSDKTDVTNMFNAVLSKYPLFHALNVGFCASNNMTETDKTNVLNYLK